MKTELKTFLISYTYIVIGMSCLIGMKAFGFLSSYGLSTRIAYVVVAAAIIINGMLYSLKTIDKL